MQRNFDRQMRTVQNLEIPPDSRYTLIDYRVEEWAGNHVCVTRSYAPADWLAAGLAYHECIKIGPRGATTTIYKNFY